MLRRDLIAFHSRLWLWPREGLQDDGQKRVVPDETTNDGIGRDARVCGRGPGADVDAHGDVREFHRRAVVRVGVYGSVSGIKFRDSTHLSGGFVIDYSSTFFGPGNYLTAGVGPVDGLGSHFGFTADLPSGADEVSLDVMYVGGFSSLIILRGYTLTGELVAEQAGPPDAPQPFNLGINSSEFNIRKIQVSADAVSTGYDNIKYTVLPEPGLSSSMLISVAMMNRRRRRSDRTV